MNAAREFSIPLAKRACLPAHTQNPQGRERSPRAEHDDPWTPGPPGGTNEPPPEEPTAVEQPEVIEEPTVVEEPADASSRGQARSSVVKLRQELHDLRAQLEGFQLDLPADGAGLD